MRSAELERSIAEDLTADLRVERLAQHAGIGPRNFARRYTETRKRTLLARSKPSRSTPRSTPLEETSDRIEVAHGVVDSAMKSTCGVRS